MQLPLQVTFRGIPPSEAIEQDVRKRAAKLERFHNHIQGCRVTVEPAHQHHHQGNLFHVRVDITVPGGELVASREKDAHHAHEDAHVAVRDAFAAVERQLQKFADERRGDVKTHAVPAHGVVDRIVPAENYGIIRTDDGREIYFHRHSVLDAKFDKLAPGTAVRFAEESGEQGPQASSVQVEGKHHVVGH